MSPAAAARGGRRGRPGSPRARLFVALDPTVADRRRLAAWRDRALEGRDDLRAIATEALHLTLAFLGYRPEKEIAAIARAALAAFESPAPPRLTARGVSAVPSRAPRLFALDLLDEDGRAAAIQAVVSQALAAGRFYVPERRPFWPHLTFARVKRGQHATPIEREPPQDPIEGGEVTLYRSLLSPQGARYEPLERRALR